MTDTERPRGRPASIHLTGVKHANLADVARIVDALEFGKEGRIMADRLDIVPSDLGELLGDDTRQGFHITDKESLFWTGDRRAALSRKLTDIDNMEKDAISKITAWATRERAKLMHPVGYLDAEMHSYLQEHRDELLAGKSKTYSTPSWEAKWRSKAARLEVVDKEALQKWLEEQPEFARIKLEPDMKKIQDLGKQGVIPPGCDWKPEEESLSITFLDPLLPESK